MRGGYDERSEARADARSDAEDDAQSRAAADDSERGDDDAERERQVHSYDEREDQDSGWADSGGLR